MLRMVPLPRADAQGRKGADASPPPCSASETGEGDHPHRASKDARLSTGYGVVEGARREAVWESNGSDR